MKPPVELHRPTLLNIIAIVCYCLAMLFHIIAFATDNWSSVLLDGVRWRVGLWHGCMQDPEDSTWHCSKAVFDSKEFQTGISSDWHVGARIMMILALIALFILEFFVIGYACIKSLDRFRGTLIAVIIGLSLTAAFSHFLVLIMYGTEVQKIPESSVKASYGVIVISFILELALPVLIHLDKNKRFPLSRSFIATKFKKSTSTQPPSSTPNRGSNLSHANDRSRRAPASSIEEAMDNMPGSMRTSVSSLSQAETFKKFAHMDPAGPSVGSIPASVRTSASSLSEADTYRKFARLPEPEGSVGSSSLRTQSTAYTNVSYLPDNMGSREMAI